MPEPKATPPFTEYDYERHQGHLTESEAIEEYQRIRCRYHDARIRWKDLECGHSSIKIAKTEEEKQELLQETLRDYLKQFISRFSR